MRRVSTSTSSLALLITLSLAACSGDDVGGVEATTTTALNTTIATTAPTSTVSTIMPSTPPSGPRAFAALGPYPVGYTTLKLDNGTPVAVWYPAVPGSETGRTKVAYDMRDYLPESERAKVADITVATFTMDAYADLPAAKPTQKFPFVLFSHGLAGYRTQSSFLTASLASWGFVVAAPQHPSRDLAAVLANTLGQGQDDLTDLRQTLQLMTGAAMGGGNLAGIFSPDRYAIVGHSAGGGAAYRMAGDVGVVTYVAMASAGGGAAVPVPQVPSMFLAGAADALVNIDRVKTSFDTVIPAPKTLAVLTDVTHLGFSDICTIARDEGGVLELAKAANVAVNEVTLRLYGDSCDQKYPKPEEDAWPAVRHLVTADLRARFGIDPSPVGLDESVETAYSPLQIDLTTVAP
ncbi:MAG TPA: hypothetical protein VF855_12800 [Acidimicrobiales bacterium]